VRRRTREARYEPSGENAGPDSFPAAVLASVGGNRQENAANANTAWVPVGRVSERVIAGGERSRAAYNGQGAEKEVRRESRTAAQSQSGETGC